MPVVSSSQTAALGMSASFVLATETIETELFCPLHGYVPRTRLENCWLCTFSLETIPDIVITSAFGYHPLPEEVNILEEQGQLRPFVGQMKKQVAYDQDDISRSWGFGTYYN